MANVLVVHALGFNQSAATVQGVTSSCAIQKLSGEPRCQGGAVATLLSEAAC